ncbi:hypothetical protein I6N90_14395 [Paenibacillus sp. GSMTC-2017]|uniref:hypothetical protein n=1 Tax=Paenibacillus sp. GSMTC-2017 TaxID=2794350 RepID=UPI0018D82B88|nr:hypothetical protein [Paenibacillus sp. GSMTC-2017]MBH5318992.1 hypothetical protein [Paenibacillus sp. GSMTC-2017]
MNERKKLSYSRSGYLITMQKNYITNENKSLSTYSNVKIGPKGCGCNLIVTKRFVDVAIFWK